METQDTTCLISLLETGTSIVSVLKEKILSLVHIPFYKKQQCPIIGNNSRYGAQVLRGVCRSVERMFVSAGG
ncbi:hypothetical protein D0784_20870 [Vibrio campbellii]|nr:hypothetical protein D0784_20870 [Vibrio campbellii]